jgi:hypothetical protein
MKSPLGEGLGTLEEIRGAMEGHQGEEAVLWGTRTGAEDWEEEVITIEAGRIEKAARWALASGFGRLRVQFINTSKPWNPGQGFQGAMGA